MVYVKLITRDTLNRSIEKKRAEKKSVTKKRQELCRELLTRTDALMLVQYTNQDGKTPLHKACWYDFPLDIIKSMCSIDPNLITRCAISDGNTPLHHACARASEDVVKYLLSKGTPAVAIANKRKRLPVHDAIDSRRSASIVKSILLSHPTSIYAIDRYKRTPLQHFYHKWLMEANLEGILKEEYGGQARLKVKSLLTLLVMAHVHGTVEEAGALLGRWFPLHEALKMRMPKMFRLILLRTMPEEILREDEMGNFPFHIECAGPRRYC